MMEISKGNEKESSLDWMKDLHLDFQSVLLMATPTGVKLAKKMALNLVRARETRMVTS